MRELLDAELAKKLDVLTQVHYGIPGMVLMERAALILAWQVEKEMASPEDSVLCICSYGNNGGDGIACARILLEKGYQVSVFMVGNGSKATEENQQQLETAKQCGVKLLTECRLEEYDILVDAIFGIGLSRVVEGTYADMIHKINKSGRKVIAADIPSGIDASTGKVWGVAVHADVTVTFGAEKLGHLLYPGRDYCGRTVVGEIGFPKKAVDDIATPYFTYEPKDYAKKMPKRPSYSNKGTFGRVLVIAGSREMFGAAYLAAKAAYRLGAGLVKVLTEESNVPILKGKLPEALVASYSSRFYRNQEQEKQILSHLNWASVVLIGPGIGMGEEAKRLMELVLSSVHVPLVVDADGINLLGRFAELKLPENAVITPHLMEMSRLIAREVPDIRENLIQAAKETARNKKITVVLKDACTIVTDGEKTYLNSGGNSGLATGGSGDVLAGMIAGLIAQKMTPYEAACLGTGLHAMAADAALGTGKQSEYSLMAGDIVETLTTLGGRHESVLPGMGRY